MSQSETIMSFCPHCGNRIRIDIVKSKGGRRGGWVLECVSCRKPFHQRLGGDIDSSRVFAGALILATYEDSVPESRIGALERLGLSSESETKRASDRSAFRKISRKR
jgi:hypothetical protein